MAYEPNTPKILFSTDVDLGNGGVFESAILKIENWQQVQTNITSDVSGEIQIDFMQNVGGEILRTLTIPYVGGSDFQTFSAPCFTPYVKYTYTNGVTPQGQFYFDTKALKSALSPQVLGVDSFISPKMVSTLGRSVLVGETIAGTYKNLTVDEIAGNRSLFDEQITTERTPLIEINSALGLSALRDTVTEVGTGTVTNAAGEFALATGTDTASTAQLQTVEHGRYYPGTAAQVGLGIRIPDTYTGTAYTEWGYFGTTDGFGFGTDATGDYIFYTRAGNKTLVRRNNWEVDKMNGDGVSGATLDIADGNIYQINFSWYGYGVVEWYVVTDGLNGRQVPNLIHRYRPVAANSIQNPNQPINVKVNNGDQATDYTVYVGGRQYSVYGRYIPSFRRTQEHRIGSTNNVSTIFVPLISFKRKTGKEGFPVKFHEVSLITTASIIWEVRVSPTINVLPENFVAISNIPANETALEVDITATTISGGIKVEGGLVGTSGTGVNQSGDASNDSFNIEIPATEIVTLCARTISGSATVTALMGMEEEW